MLISNRKFCSLPYFIPCLFYMSIILLSWYPIYQSNGCDLFSSSLLIHHLIYNLEIKNKGLIIILRSTRDDKMLMLSEYQYFENYVIDLLFLKYFFSKKHCSLLTINNKRETNIFMKRKLLKINCLS